MKSKHTPGPWKASRIPRNYGCYGQQIEYAGPTAHWNSLAHNKEVALVLTDSPEDRANARLIAAAPDLLEALQDTLSCLEAYCHTAYAESEVRQEARAAIAKATAQP